MKPRATVNEHIMIIKTTNKILSMTKSYKLLKPVDNTDQTFRKEDIENNHSRHIL